MTNPWADDDDDEAEDPLEGLELTQIFQMLKAGVISREQVVKSKGENYALALESRTATKADKEAIARLRANNPQVGATSTAGAAGGFGLDLGPLASAVKKKLPPKITPPGAGTAAPSRKTYSANVERWRPLVEKYFPPELVDKALHVINFESGGNASASGDNGVAIGLFQIQDSTRFKGRPTKAQLLDPEFNIKYAAESLGAASGKWGDWGEGTLYNGKPFGALGNHPYNFIDSPTGGGTAITGSAAAEGIAGVVEGVRNIASQVPGSAAWKKARKQQLAEEYIAQFGPAAVKVERDKDGKIIRFAVLPDELYDPETDVALAQQIIWSDEEQDWVPAERDPYPITKEYGTTGVQSQITGRKTTTPTEVLQGGRYADKSRPEEMSRFGPEGTPIYDLPYYDTANPGGQEQFRRGLIPQEGGLAPSLVTTEGNMGFRGFNPQGDSYGVGLHRFDATGLGNKYTAKGAPTETSFLDPKTPGKATLQATLNWQDILSKVGGNAGASPRHRSAAAGLAYARGLMSEDDLLDFWHQTGGSQGMPDPRRVGNPYVNDGFDYEAAVDTAMGEADNAFKPFKTANYNVDSGGNISGIRSYRGPDGQGSYSLAAYRQLFGQDPVEEFAKGGNMTIDKPMVLVEMDSGQPRAIMGEAGMQETMQPTPRGLRITPTRRPIGAGRSFGRPMLGRWGEDNPHPDYVAQQQQRSSSPMLNEYFGQQLLQLPPVPPGGGRGGFYSPMGKDVTLGREMQPPVPGGRYLMPPTPPPGGGFMPPGGLPPAPRGEIFPPMPSVDDIQMEQMPSFSSRQPLRRFATGGFLTWGAQNPHPDYLEQQAQKQAQQQQMMSGGSSSGGSTSNPLADAAYQKYVTMSSGNLAASSADLTAAEAERKRQMQLQNAWAARDQALGKKVSGFQHAWGTRDAAEQGMYNRADVNPQLDYRNRMAGVETGREKYGRMLSKSAMEKAMQSAALGREVSDHETERDTQFGNLSREQADSAAARELAASQRALSQQNASLAASAAKAMPGQTQAQTEAGQAWMQKLFPSGGGTAEMAAMAGAQNWAGLAALMGITLPELQKRLAGPYVGTK